MTEFSRKDEYLFSGIFFTAAGIYGVARWIYAAVAGILLPLKSGELLSLFFGIVSLVIGYTFLVLAKSKSAGG